MPTQPMTSNSWDFDCFPLDLPEKVKLATTPPPLPIPSKWDVPKTPIQYTFQARKSGIKCFINILLLHILITLHPLPLPKVNYSFLLGKCLF